MTVDKALLLAPMTAELLPETVQDICETLAREVERLRERSGLCSKHKIAHFKCGCPDIVDVEAERDKYREALERIEDDADCVDMEECKEVAHEALRR